MLKVKPQFAVYHQKNGFQSSRELKLVYDRIGQIIGRVFDRDDWPSPLAEYLAELFSGIIG